MSFELPDLGYDYDALEPHLDALTMEIHHTKHHNAYTNNLNAAIAGTEMADKTIEELMRHHSDNIAIRNNGGGYWNHRFFWQIMSPTGGGVPAGSLADSIDSQFGSLDEMKSQFATAAMTRFGSGWAWLVVDAKGMLSITSTPNQDNPLMTGAGTPILGLDVWEHAYYKKFGPGRADYIAAWWNVVDWTAVAMNHAAP
ncbi:MAG TPA: superoxide dismutase [Candidatus Poseidoniales archaeon]|nr:superoxide dismutase [Candidatus Poseidoniales archaeon]